MIKQHTICLIKNNILTKNVYSHFHLFLNFLYSTHHTSDVYVYIPTDAIITLAMCVHIPTDAIITLVMCVHIPALAIITLVMCVHIPADAIITLVMCVHIPALAIITLVMCVHIPADAITRCRLYTTPTRLAHTIIHRHERLR